MEEPDEQGESECQTPGGGQRPLGTVRFDLSLLSDRMIEALVQRSSDKAIAEYSLNPRLAVFVRCALLADRLRRSVGNSAAEELVLPSLTPGEMLAAMRGAVDCAETFGRQSAELEELVVELRTVCQFWIAFGAALTEQFDSLVKAQQIRGGIA